MIRYSVVDRCRVVLHDHGKEVIVANHGLQLLLLLLSGQALGGLLFLHLLMRVVEVLLRRLVVLNDCSAHLLLVRFLVFVLAPHLVQWAMLAGAADVS